MNIDWIPFSMIHQCESHASRHGNEELEWCTAEVVPGRLNGKE